MKLKRFVAASLAAVTVFSLAACGSKSADTTTKAAGETKATGKPEDLPQRPAKLLNSERFYS